MHQRGKITILYSIHVPYCPKQAPMGARSSTAKKWGWAVTRRRCLNGSTIPMQGPTPDAKLAARVYRIVASSVLHQGQPDSGESSVVLQSWPTRSLVAKFLQSSVVACSTQISCCRERMLQTRLRTGVCDAWCCDVQSAPEESQLCELSEPTFRFTTQEFSIVGVYTENLKETTKLSKVGGGHLFGYGRLLRTIRYVAVPGRNWTLFHTYFNPITVFKALYAVLLLRAELIRCMELSGIHAYTQHVWFSHLTAYLCYSTLNAVMQLIYTRWFQLGTATYTAGLKINIWLMFNERASMIVFSFRACLSHIF